MGKQTLGYDSICTNLCAALRAGPLRATLTSVQSEEALVTQHFLKAVKAVFIHELSHKGAGRSLVLHSSLYKIDRIHSGGSDS